MSKDYLGTYNGSVFYPIDSTRVDDVNLESIAFALSKTSRFCGHTDRFWSVAQHSLLVADIIANYCKTEIENNKLNPDYAELIGLLHDASEAYLSDICRPIKKFMGDYAKYESIVQNKIYRAFEITEEDIAKYSKYTKFADDTALYTEAIALMNPSSMWLNDYADGFANEAIHNYVDSIKLENMQIVEAKFICRCIELCSRLGKSIECIGKLPKYKCFSNELPIFSCGKVLCYIRIKDKTVEISYQDKELKFNIGTINNTIDLRYLLDQKLGGSFV